MIRTSAPPLIRTEGLRKTFRRRDDEVVALDGIDLAVEGGTVFGLLGHNGSGKTTLIRILTTLTEPTAGRAWIRDLDVTQHPKQVRAALGVTAQQTTLDQRISGRENLVVLSRLHGLSRAAARDTAASLLNRYGLAAAADRPVSTYSGGMRRRLDIISSLVSRPAVLFLDEPTTGLDPQSRSEIWTTVRELASDGTTVLLTTQYLEEADQLATFVAILSSGRAIAEGTPRSLKERIGLQLSVSLREEHQRDATQRVLNDLGVTQLGSGSAPDHDSEKSISGLVTAGSLTLPVILNSLESAGVAVADIGLLEPTLDEAYLALTGAAA